MKFECDQMLDLIENAFKAVIINMFEEKKKMF